MLKRLEILLPFALVPAEEKSRRTRDMGFRQGRRGHPRGRCRPHLALRDVHQEVPHAEILRPRV